MLHFDDEVTLVCREDELSTRNNQPASLDSARLRLGCLTVSDYDVAIKSMLVLVSMGVDAIEISASATCAVCFRSFAGAPLGFACFVDAGVKMEGSELSSLGQTTQLTERKLE